MSILTPNFVCLLPVYTVSNLIHNIIMWPFSWPKTSTSDRIPPWDLFLVSSYFTSNNSTSRNIGEGGGWMGRPPPQILEGPSPKYPLSLRPCFCLPPKVRKKSNLSLLRCFRYRMFTSLSSNGDQSERFRRKSSHLGVRGNLCVLRTTCVQYARCFDLQRRGLWTWWRIGWVDDFQPEGRGFDSRSSRHVGTLDKSFTCSCLCASAWNSDTLFVL